MLVSVAPTRLWRLKQGLRCALRCRALLGKSCEVLLGHMTFVSLLRRYVLSVPFSLNKFVRANYETSARLWPSARAEVQAFVGLLPAISSSWTRDWCSCIVATDASEYGFGVCLKECEKSVCQAIGRTSERARFRKCRTNTIGARTAFFEHHRLWFDTCVTKSTWMRTTMRLMKQGSSLLLIFLRYHSKLWKPVDGKMLHGDNGDIQMKT